VTAPNGKLVSVFGDTFSGRKVGRGDWRSPVILIGTGDASNRIVYERAGGPDPDYARQLWHYDHDGPDSGWTRSGISTVIPSDLLRVRDTLYLHVIVNRGFGNVAWTEIWRSDDSGISWTNMGERARFAADLHDGHAQCWSWDYDRQGDWVYVVSTGFQRDKGIILQRVRPAQIGDSSRYWAWGSSGDGWSWGRRATPITPNDETWGELTLRRLITGEWVLGGFVSSNYALGYRVLGEPTDDVAAVPLQTPVFGSGWRGENHAKNMVAQVYGGYVLPGSQLDMPGGVGLVVSQWRTDAGWPYRAMQFNVTLRNTTVGPHTDTP
jgi:Domain of unknown function (DUF4185)